MASKELFAQVEQIIWRDRARVFPSKSTDLANEILNTIFAALQEPTEGMVDALFTENGCSEDFKKYVTNRIRHDWSAMLAASALGEQSDRAEIISADGAIWDETAPGTRNFKRREQSE